MIFKTYDQNDKFLTESIKLAGLSEYKAQKLIHFANENKINIQKAYLLTDASVIKVDIILAFVMSFFTYSIIQKDFTELWAFLSIFGLLFFVIELTCRLHKNYFKVCKAYIKLRGI
ncbi:MULTISPECIES: hypothetical protein [unclassified Citrobacter]|uniref:hypothetical protein n=1 Tax=unclassified Citrobacter TaxID=2644389 RepID=UPI0015E4FE48|nr:MULTISPECIES: hypothetical protein [unclassified Citrobacter]QLO85386.1 hypothetical protein HV334_17010 [Citrobacter sp. RHBSTW-00944]QLX39112.1 hypothetical protein HV135_07785 [Citrobacter sp. RHBSTW-00229]